MPDYITPDEPAYYWMNWGEFNPDDRDRKPDEGTLRVAQEHCLRL